MTEQQISNKFSHTDPAQSIIHALRHVSHIIHRNSGEIIGIECENKKALNINHRANNTFVGRLCFPQLPNSERIVLE